RERAVRRPSATVWHRDIRRVDTWAADRLPIPVRTYRPAMERIRYPAIPDRAYPVPRLSHRFDSPRSNAVAIPYSPNPRRVGRFRGRLHVRVRRYRVRASGTADTPPRKRVRCPVTAPAMQAAPT